MARRTGLTREEIYNQAISAGIAMVSEDGLKNFSMRQVAKQIGYTVGTLYNVFKNQDDFLLKINALTLQEMYQFIQSTADQNLQGKDLLLSIAISYYSFAKDNFFRWKVLFEYNLVEENSLPEWYTEKIEHLMSFAEQSLVGLNLTKPQIQKSSRTLWSAVHGICILSLSGKLAATKSNSAEDLINDLIDRYFIGLTIQSR